MLKFLKISSVLLALLMTFGCSENRKTEDTPDEIAGEPIETVTDENENTIYNSSDFKKIQVLTSVIEDDAPLDMKTINFDPIIEKLGSRMSPCKADDVWQDYVGWIGDGNGRKEPFVDESVRIKESTAQIMTSAYAGNAFYFLASFDNYCGGMHDWEMCRYNIETDEISVIYDYEGLESLIVAPKDMRYANGKLYFRDYDEEINGFSIFSMDTETGEMERVFQGNKDEIKLGFGNNIIKIDELLDAGENRIVFADYTYEDDDINKRVKAAVLYELDFETGTFNEIFRNDNLYDAPIFADGKIVFIEKNENNRIRVNTEDYSFDTDFRTADLAYADSESVALVRTDTTEGYNNERKIVKATFYVFDFKTQNEYMLDTTKLGSSFIKTKNGFLTFHKNNGFSKTYFIAPESGYTVFTGLTNGNVISLGSTVSMRSGSSFTVISKT